MLYDLNVAWSPTKEPLELQRTISFLSELGYGTIALNHIHHGPLPSNIVNPIPTSFQFPLPPKTVLLRRCTLVLSDPSLNHRLTALSSVYDILALRPTTEKAFLAACLNLSEHSIISLDLTQRFPFHFKPKPLMTAVNRGVRFEICYAQATMEDANARRNFISNCLGIFRATRGRGIVISSEAKSALGVRGPADVVNLMAVWGLGREKGLEGLGDNPRAVVINEGLKRSSFRGVVDVVYGGERKAFKDTDGGEGIKNGSGNGEKGKTKRKADDKETKADGTPQLSKRQAKKQRMEALKAAEASSSSSKNPSPISGSPAPESVDSKIKYQYPPPEALVVPLQQRQAPSPPPRPWLKQTLPVTALLLEPSVESKRRLHLLK
ncbi:RNAse P subunit p30 protein [Rutstroemia sp. NJR-2017a WRK4]|nr:RNAse P subunit p30 protein [Rutstroemia sp. NJR-2017a WRK4]